MMTVKVPQNKRICGGWWKKKYWIYYLQRRNVDDKSFQKKVNTNVVSVTVQEHRERNKNEDKTGSECDRIARQGIKEF